jgi:hypothetical protein
VIVKEGLSLWSAGESLGDDHTPTSTVEYLKRIPYVETSSAMNREAPPPTEIKNSCSRLC